MPMEVIWELWYVPYEKILHYGMVQNLVHLLINYGREVNGYNTGMAVRGQLLKKVLLRLGLLLCFESKLLSLGQQASR